MWPFSRKSNRAPRLTGVSEHLWSYDARHQKGWQLDTDGATHARHRQQARTTITLRRARQQEKLSHYIGAGGMRHEARDKIVRQRPIEGQTYIWRLFVIFIFVWLIFRWIPC